MRLYQVDVGYACFGVDVEAGRVVAAPPIARWMVGKPWSVCAAWIGQKGGTVLALADATTPAGEAR